MSETTLWTNSNPTSDFANQTVTLNQSYSSFNYIKVYYKARKTTTAEYSCIFTKSDMALTSDTNDYPSMSLYSVISGTGYQRTVRHNTYSSLDFGYGLPVYSTSSRNNGNIIPTKICGLK